MNAVNTLVVMSRSFVKLGRVISKQIGPKHDISRKYNILYMVKIEIFLKQERVCSLKDRLVVVFIDHMLKILV